MNDNADYFLVEEFPFLHDCDPEQHDFDDKRSATDYYNQSAHPERTLYRVTNGNRQYPPILSTEDWTQ